MNRLDDGFVLLEVLLAVLVLSVGIVSAFGVFSHAMNAVRLSADRYTGALLAEAMVCERELTGKAPENPGVNRVPLPGAEVKTNVERRPAEGLNLIQITVSWEARRRREELTLPCYEVN